nr:hypothetical protein [Tanacetum cinerariifolium]
MTSATTTKRVLEEQESWNKELSICTWAMVFVLSKNDVLYFNAIPSNGIYEIDMSNLVPNVNFIYNVSNKRVKHNLDSVALSSCSYNKSHNVLGIASVATIDRQLPFEYTITSRSTDVIVLTPPYTPQHNGVSERRNRILLDMVRSMMNLTTLPSSFWDYDLESVAHILNMVPTKKRDTPGKLQQRYVKCIFIRYPKEIMGYYFYFPPENKIVVARYAEFFEKNLLSQEVSGRAEELEEIQDEYTSPSKITSEIPMEVECFEPPHEEEAPVHRFVRIHRAPKRLCLNVEVDEHSLGDLNEPANYKAAMLDPKFDKWLDAMNAEMQFMTDNQVWRLVDLPPNSKGYTQLYGVDYEETFSPVADIIAISIFIAIATFHDYEI